MILRAIFPEEDGDQNVCNGPQATQYPHPRVEICTERNVRFSYQHFRQTRRHLVSNFLILLHRNCAGNLYFGRGWGRKFVPANWSSRLEKTSSFEWTATSSPHPKRASSAKSRRPAVGQFTCEPDSSVSDPAEDSPRFRGRAEDLVLRKGTFLKTPTEMPRTRLACDVLCEKSTITISSIADAVPRQNTTSLRTC